MAHGIDLDALLSITEAREKAYEGVLERAADGENVQEDARRVLDEHQVKSVKHPDTGVAAFAA